MNLQADKKWIERELKNLDDPNFIAVIKKMLKDHKEIGRLESIDLEQYNNEINRSLLDVEMGNLHTHNSVKEIMQQWTKK